MSSRYYKKLDLIRFFSCIAILLYHVGILKGGYLAVCTFFVLSGYLSVMSAFKKSDFSLKEYYINRFKKIYLPLLVVVFTSIGVISLLPSIDWINLKPETTSVLCGYNNFWQLNANLDYFVRHISSPFMHLWYISLLIQFEIIFPLIFISLKKLGEKIGKIFLCLILGILGIGSYLLFYKTVSDGNLMTAYYGTFTRAFSLLLGLFLGFVHYYYHPVVIKEKTLSKMIFYVYLIALFIIFCLVDVKCSFFNLSMIVTTLISMRLIDYGLFGGKKIGIFDNFVSSISKVSYEIYLVQYPVIFILQEVGVSCYIRVPLVIVITLFISYILNNAINFNKNKSLKKFNIVILIPIILFTVFGGFKYITSKDYTNEMKKLEEDLSENRKLIEAKQKEFQERQRQEEDEWEQFLNDLDKDEEALKEVVKNMRIVGVGDSVMELAVKDLYKEFPNGYFDGVVNRTERQTIQAIKELKEKDMLGDILVLNVGTNGNCNQRCKDQLMEEIGDRKVYWLNATHPDYDTFNPSLEEVANRYDNIRIIDWVSVTKDHPEYLISDKVHPTVKGCKVYVQTIFNAIYQDYLDEFNKKKQEKIKEHEQKENSKVTFIGNDLLLGLYDYIRNDFNNSDLVTDKDFGFNTIKSKLNSMVKNNSLLNNVMFVFDKSLSLNKKQYEELVKLCNKRNVYIVDVTGNLKIDKENVHIIDFSKQLKNNKNYINVDGIHLTNEGNNALENVIRNTLNGK